MSWPFIAVFLSGWLYVDARYRGPRWQGWVFKPVTLLLLLLLAWQAPVIGTNGYLIVLGLLATLVADALLLLPRERYLYAIGAFFLSHLLYTLSFASQMSFTFFWPLPAVLVVVGACSAGDYLEPTGGNALGGDDVYRHDATDGVGRRRAVLLSQHRFGLLAALRLHPATGRQHCLAAEPLPF